MQSPDRGSGEDQWQQPENVQQHFGQAYPQPPQQQWRMQPRAEQAAHAQQAAQAPGAAPAQQVERAAWGLRPQQPRLAAGGAGTGASGGATGAGSGATGWRWVAHPPFGAPGAPPHPLAEQQWQQRRGLLDNFCRETEPSPRYARPPRWGLPHVAVRPLAEGDSSVGGKAAGPGDRKAKGSGRGKGARLEVLAGTGDPVADRAALHDRAADRTSFLLRAASWLVVAGVVAAVIGWGRYAMLVALRGQVVPVWVQWLSAGAVYLANAAAFVVSLLVFVALAQWLRAVRARRFHPRRDPRGRWEIAALVVIPGVNLLYLPVLLREAGMLGETRRGNGARGDGDAGGADGDPRTRRRARTAWAALAAGELVGALYWWQLLSPGTQSAANALSLGATMAALAALAAWALRRAVRSAGRTQRLRRLVYVGAVPEQTPATAAEATPEKTPAAATTPEIDN